MSISDTSIRFAQVYQGSQETVMQSTTDYGRFKFDASNRPIDQEHVARLYDAISAKNLLHLFPILVSEDYRILDGQHRTLAAEALGVPIYYIVSPEMTIEDVPHATARVTPWKTEDYLHHWCARGSSEYLKLRAFWKRYGFLSLTQARALCFQGNAVGLSDVFKNGRYQCNNVAFAERVVFALLDFKGAGVDFYGHRSFVPAVANLMSNPSYDHKKMMEKLEYLSLRMVRCTDIKTYIAMINDIYNYKVRNRTELRVIHSSNREYRQEAKTSE